MLAEAKTDDRICVAFQRYCKPVECGPKTISLNRQYYALDFACFFQHIGFRTFGSTLSLPNPFRANSIEKTRVFEAFR